jgi:hypothetical protein
LSPSQGTPLRSGSRHHGRDHPLLGFCSPSTTSACGSVTPGSCLPGTIRPRGFSPPRRFHSPQHLAATRAAAVHGVLSPIRDLFAHLAAVRRRTARDPLPQGFRSLRSETQGERHHDAGSLEALCPGTDVVTPSAPRPRGVPLRSSSSRPAAATGVAAIPLTRFLPRLPSVKRSASGRRPRVCTVRNLRIYWRPAAPVGLSCTYETRSGASRCVHPHGAGAPRRAGGRPCPRRGGLARHGSPRLRPPPSTGISMSATAYYIA